MELGKIKKRIKSIKNTSQITKAMELVSAVKMKRAQTSALNGRSYTTLMNEILDSLGTKVSPEIHQFFQNKPGPPLILFVSTDRGLCGALNSNLYRELSGQEVFKDKETKIITVGTKGRQFVVRASKDLTADFPIPAKPDYELARVLGKLIMSQYLQGEIKSFYALYTHYESTLKQVPVFKKILPIEKIELESKEETKQTKIDYLYEPDPNTVLRALLPHFVEMEIYQILMEASASEHSARMIAMKNATDNALDLVDEFTLSYNQARQEAITKELLDITTALITVS